MIDIFRQCNSIVCSSIILKLKKGCKRRARVSLLAKNYNRKFIRRSLIVGAFSNSGFCDFSSSHL